MNTTQTAATARTKKVSELVEGDIYDLDGWGVQVAHVDGLNIWTYAGDLDDRTADDLVTLVDRIGPVAEAAA